MEMNNNGFNDGLNNNSLDVAILGASRNPERYSYMALERLMEAGHRVYPVNPALEEIIGVKVYHSLSEISAEINTLTVYVSPRHITSMIDEIVSIKPKRVILNPGTESEALKAALEKADITYIEACTLVMLSTDQF